jgi:hypothetical protein
MFISAPQAAGGYFGDQTLPMKEGRDADRQAAA